MKFHSKDKRKKVGIWMSMKISLLRSFGMSGVDIAKKVGISKSTVYRHLDNLFGWQACVIFHVHTYSHRYICLPKFFEMGY